MHSDFKISIEDLFSRFQYVKQLGEGCFGKIYELYDVPTKTSYAVKKVFIDPKYHNRELENFFMLKNKPGVLQIEKYCEIDLDDLTIYMEKFADKKGSNFTTMERDSLWSIQSCYTKVLYILTKTYSNNLRNFIIANKVNKNNFKQIAMQLLKGLDSMHSVGIAHRDLKPDNILINEGTLEVVVADLGSAKKIESNGGGISYICSRAYRAPELLLGSTVYGTAIDLWSLGCVLVEMITESTNRFFKGKNGTEVLKEIISLLGPFNNQDLQDMNVVKNVKITSQIEQVDVKKLIKKDFSASDIDFVMGFLKWSPLARKDLKSVVESKYFS